MPEAVKPCRHRGAALSRPPFLILPIEYLVAEGQSGLRPTESRALRRDRGNAISVPFLDGLRGLAADLAHAGAGTAHDGGTHLVTLVVTPQGPRLLQGHLNKAPMLLPVGRWRCVYTGSMHVRRACGSKSNVSVDARPKTSEANFSRPKTAKLAVASTVTHATSMIRFPAIATESRPAETSAMPRLDPLALLCFG